MSCVVIIVHCLEVEKGILCFRYCVRTGRCPGGFEENSDCNNFVRVCYSGILFSLVDSK